MKQLTDNQPKTTLKIFTIPNILSFFRICLIPWIVWLYCVEQEYQTTGYILILSGITDIVDGFLARKFNMISDLGKILDPIADKLTQAVMLICLMVRFPLMILPLILMVVKETFMGVTGVLVIQKKGIVHGANWHGKAATVLLYAMMINHVFWTEIPPIASTVSIILCTVMIGISFVLYGIRNIKALRQCEPTQEGAVNG